MTEVNALVGGHSPSTLAKRHHLASGNPLPLVSVVMPCLNEERTVGTCVQKAIAAFDRLCLNGEVIVSDNGSIDGSVEIAERCGARVVSCAARGYGNAIRYGVQEAGGQFIIVGDCDDSYDFSAIEDFIGPLRDGSDLVMGNRFAGNILPGAMPWKNRYIGNPILTSILNTMFGTRVGDAHCGLRGFTRTAFDQMRLESSGMEFASEMIVKAAKCHLLISEVPTSLAPDGRGRPPHLRPWRDGWRHLTFLLMFSPLHLFMVPGIVLAVAGLVLVLALAGGPLQVKGFRFDFHWMILGVLVLLAGIQIFQFGVVARMHTVMHRFREHDPGLNWLRRLFSLERGLIFSSVLFLIGFVVDAGILVEWLSRDFGPLHRFRAALLATTLMAAGLQLWFFSFLFSILDAGSTDEPSPGEVPHVSPRSPQS